MTLRKQGTSALALPDASSPIYGWPEPPNHRRMREGRRERERGREEESERRKREGGREGGRDRGRERCPKHPTETNLGSPIRKIS